MLFICTYLDGVDSGLSKRAPYYDLNISGLHLFFVCEPGSSVSAVSGYWL
jgi:hypothetical protein